MKSRFQSLFTIIYLVFAWTVSSQSVAASPPAESVERHSHSTFQPSIQTAISYCIDHDKRYTIETIHHCEFQPRENLPIARLAHSEFWIQARVNTDQQSLNQLLVDIRPHFLFEVLLYQKENQTWTTQRAGSKYSSSQAQSTLGGYTFLTNDISNKQSELFLHIKTVGLIYTAVSIEPYTLAVLNKNNKQIGIGIQVGALIFIILFLLTAQILNPKLKLGRFNILMTIVLMAYLSGSGIFSEYLLVNHPELDDFIFLGLLFLRVTGWVWVTQGILNTFSAPSWYNVTCRIFYCFMLASLILNYLELNVLGGGLMLSVFFMAHIIQVAAVTRTPDMPRLYKATLLIALILSDLILILTLFLTQYPIISPGTAIYFARISDFVYPLILLIVILLGGKFALTELNLTKSRLTDLAQQSELERALLNERKLLVDMLTHEVRTPLGSIRLAINSIKKYFQSNDEIDIKRFNNIHQSLKNIDDIIEHCSLMNQIDQQALEVHFTHLCLNEFIKEYIAELDNESLSRLHFNLQGRITIGSDSYILKIIFTNLIQNALKYSLRNSTIQIDIHTSTSSDRQVVISVSNELDPLHTPDLNHMFDRYYRCPSIKNISGTGLGLHLSQALSQKLGGQLSASIKNEKITFYLTLEIGESA